MIPSTVRRVPEHTRSSVNEAIRRQTERNLERYRHATPDVIERRLRQLNEEWDVERMLEANAATLSLLGWALGTTVDRRWYALPAVVAGFLLQHAVQGWCPPLPVLRQLGYRTSYEIDQERYALKAMRGDFDQLNASGDRASPGAALQAARI